MTISSDIDVFGPTSFVWSGEDDNEDLLVISWEGGKLDVKYNNVTEAARAFFDYLKQFMDSEYKVIEKDRLRSILERSREFIETHEEPIYEAGANIADLAVYRPPPSWFNYWMDQWNGEIEALNDKKKRLKRERQLAQEIDELIKELGGENE